LFELYGRDGHAVAEVLSRFRAEGRVTIDSDRLEGLRDHWSGARVDDAATLGVIRDVWQRTGMLLDPHTAVGVGAAEACRRDPDIPIVTLATAHPAKFPDAVEAATGVRPPLPAHLADLFDRPERFVRLPNDLAAVQAFVRSVARG
jgi:threonine synthase